MNITFLIGNGFELNLGMKTSYGDFYEYYLEQELTGVIADNINKKDKLWSDLELAIGEVTAKVIPGEDRAFLIDKEEMEDYLAVYLRSEEEKVKIVDIEKLIEEAKHKLLNFQKGLSAVYRGKYTRLILDTKGSVYYRFVTYNYTNILDTIIEEIISQKKTISSHTVGNITYPEYVEKPIHIHGTLDEGIILGVNDKTQIKNEEFTLNQKMLKYLLKVKANAALGEVRTEQVQKIIDESKCICLYGLSLGDTDKFWWEYIGEWLQKDTERMLIIFNHRSNKFSSSQEKLMKIDATKEKFLNQSGVSYDIAEKLEDQIAVVFGSDIFTYDNITIEEPIDDLKLEWEDKYGNVIV